MLGSGPGYLVLCLEVGQGPFFFLVCLHICTIYGGPGLSGPGLFFFTFFVGQVRVGQVFFFLLFDMSGPDTTWAS